MKDRVKQRITYLISLTKHMEKSLEGIRKGKIYLELQSRGNCRKPGSPTVDMAHKVKEESIILIMIF